MSDQARELLRRIPYGLYAITTKSADNENAMVANWVTQISFEPRLIGLAIKKSSYSLNLMEVGAVIGINIFLQEDAEFIMPITKSRHKNVDKMSEVSYFSGERTDVPVLNGAAGYLETKINKLIEVDGDHLLVVVEVINGVVLKPGVDTDTLSLPGLGWHYAG